MTKIDENIKRSSPSGLEQININLIISSVYSVEVPPAFIVNHLKSQMPYHSLELAVGAAVSSNAANAL